MPATFRIYNTLSRSVEPFRPLVDGEVSLYTCGMTVYDHAHVGHARSFVVFDVLVRYLRHRGWKVRYVRNYTDVDDKIIRRAQEEAVPASEIAERYIASWNHDAAGLGLLPPDEEPRVSTSMPAILAMVERLIEQGHAYVAGGSVWFSVATFPEYGALSGQDPTEMRCSAEADADKADPRDFALWKAAKPGEPSWPSPWGEGRPGWHIECSAMNLETLGASIDIHGGGLDLVFPHHENEIAQSVCCNKASYATYWMHNGLLTMARRTEDGLVQAAKMGKSLGNVVRIHAALEQFPREALRLYYLQSHYRSPLPWTDEALPEALAMLARLYEARDVAAAMDGYDDPDDTARSLGKDAMEVLELGRTFEDRFYAALDDDLNTAQALSLAFELARAINRLSNQKKAMKRAGSLVEPALSAFGLLGRTLGLLTMQSDAFQEEVKDKRLAAMGIDRAQVEAMVADRSAARAAKDWARADELRKRLDEARINVMDGADSVSWRVRLIE
jgi:cysteinyl-tRNA synthetase